jgi:hypothetical protein
MAVLAPVTSSPPAMDVVAVAVPPTPAMPWLALPAPPTEWEIALD